MRTRPIIRGGGAARAPVRWRPAVHLGSMRLSWPDDGPWACCAMRRVYR
jgi:hypothetical protein